jgi:hypothetical protein
LQSRFAEFPQLAVIWRGGTGLAGWRRSGVALLLSPFSLQTGNLTGIFLKLGFWLSETANFAAKAVPWTQIPYLSKQEITLEEVGIR